MRCWKRTRRCSSKRQGELASDRRMADHQGPALHSDSRGSDASRQAVRARITNRHHRRYCPPRRNSSPRAPNFLRTATPCPYLIAARVSLRARLRLGFLLPSTVGKWNRGPCVGSDIEYGQSARTAAKTYRVISIYRCDIPPARIANELPRLEPWLRRQWHLLPGLASPVHGNSDDGESIARRLPPEAEISRAVHGWHLGMLYSVEHNGDRHHLIPRRIR